MPKQCFYVVDDDFEFERDYFGGLHAHSDDTVGTNDTTYNLREPL